MNPHLFVVFLEALKDNWKTKNYVFSNINNDKFHKCRAVLKAKTKDIESQDKGNTTHAAEAISDQVVDRLYSAKQLGADNAARLQNILWCIFVSQFGMRPGVEIKKLCWGDILIGWDPDGAEYLIFKQLSWQRP